MEKEEVLVLSVGGTAEPLTFSINEFKPDLVCFLHTSKTLETCEIVLNETNEKVEIRDGSILMSKITDITKSRNGYVGSKNASISYNNKQDIQV